MNYLIFSCERCYTIKMKENCVKRNFLKFFTLVFVSLMIAVSLFSFPIGNKTESVQAESVDDYEKFYKSYMTMINSYDNVAEVADEETGHYIIRLIVKSDDEIDEQGAIYSCSFDGYTYLQYDDVESADTAYQYYDSLNNVEVTYDYNVSTDGEEVTSDAVKVTDYNSWGWSIKNDYLGLNAYRSTLSTYKNLRNVVVVVLDSGINTSHKLFKNRLLKDKIGIDYSKNFTKSSSGSSGVEDDNGHGTHVSGIIAEGTECAKSSVSILPIKVLDENGKGTVSNILSAIQYVTNLYDTLKASNYTICAMNMSFGVKASSTANEAGTVSASAFGTFAQYIDTAYSKNILSVVSAGNENADTSTIQPANIKKAITVSALTEKTSENRNYLVFDVRYSNYGSTVDFSAPGTSVKSAYIGGSTQYKELSGTSMAAPHVTACIALVYTNPNFEDKSADYIVEKLEENVDISKIYPAGDYYTGLTVGNNKNWNKYYGYGVINIANIDVPTYGTVKFGTDERFQDDEFSLTLNYSLTTMEEASLKIASYGNYSYEIRYSLEDDAKAVSADDEIYSSSISITKTTKVTAMVFYYSDVSGELIGKSALGTKTYYINCYDLDSAYTYEDCDGGVKITGYTGSEITDTLTVQSSFDGKSVVEIGENAFELAKAKKVVLPKTVKNIDDGAFENNTRIETISCDSDAVEIGECAFKNCTSLTNFDIANATNLGNSALAHTNISSLILKNVTRIEKYAFSDTPITTLLVGSKVTYIGKETQIKSFEMVYGFCDVAENFAFECGVEYEDLTLKITSDLPAKVNCTGAESLSVTVVGLVDKYKINMPENASDISKDISIETTDTSYTKTYKIKLTGLSEGDYKFSITFTDCFGNSVETKVVAVKVVSSATEKKLTVNGENFKLLVNGKEYTTNMTLFMGCAYDFQVTPSVGYTLKSLIVAGNSQSVNVKEFSVDEVTDDITIEIVAEKKTSVTVTFNPTNCKIMSGKVVVTGAVEVKSSTADYAFSIVSNEGTYLKRVTVNGELLEAGDDGVFHLTNILDDLNVDVVCESKILSVDVFIAGDLGTYSVVGNKSLSEVAYGSNREIVLSANDGYKVATVIVNGQVYDASNGKIVLNNVDEDTEIIVSFKKTGLNMFGSTDSFPKILVIVLVVLVVIILVSIILICVIKKHSYM